MFANRIKKLENRKSVNGYPKKLATILCNLVPVCEFGGTDEQTLLNMVQHDKGPITVNVSKVLFQVSRRRRKKASLQN